MVKVLVNRFSQSWRPILLAFVIFGGAIYANVEVANAAPSEVSAPPISPELQSIRSARLAEPLIRTSSTTLEEDRALVRALQRLSKRENPGATSPLEKFVSDHPQSGWAMAVWTNLGLSYIQEGYFSKAISAWRQAWIVGKDSQAPEARSLVDRAIGERAQLLASLGKYDDLAALFSDIGNRPITGSATEQVQIAQEALALSKKDPRHLYLCGPRALKALLMARGVGAQELLPLEFYKATDQGTNLKELALLAGKLKLSYRLIQRKPGDPVPDQAVMHWKVGHFAAIVGRQGKLVHIKDAVTRSGDLWVTPKALDEEASGYMLIPSSGAVGQWRGINLDEGAQVWGRGPTNGTSSGRPAGQPGANSSDNPNPSPRCGMCFYNIGEASVSISISDSPVGYKPAIGSAVVSVLNYDQREDSQPANFNFYNVGQKWKLNWLSYVTDLVQTGGSPIPSYATRFMSGGGAYHYSAIPTADQSFVGFLPQDDDGSVLVRTSVTPIIYTRTLKNGTREVYSQSDGASVGYRNIFITKIIDPQGNALSFTYDSFDRLTSISDATGRKTTFSYSNSFFSQQVTRITDPFGRSADLVYDPAGRLQSVTDVAGITSSFVYDDNSLINSLTTPYGTTTFAYTVPGSSGPPRFVDVTDPLGNHEREEWVEPAPIPESDPANTVPVGMPVTPVNGYLNYRTSFHWDKNQYVAAGCSLSGGCDYTKARQTHFLHDGNSSIRSFVIESIKQPLENRVWFQYPGETNSIFSGSYNLPTNIARALDDGTTQQTIYAYDAANFYQLTQSVDPTGRTTKYTYVNGTDLQSVQQKTSANGFSTIASFTYNSQHRPLTSTDAAGQTTKYTYNTAGQLLSATDPLGNVTQYQYDLTGNILKIINATSTTQKSFTYDAFNRLATVTDSEGWTASYSYDVADRLLAITYPDGTSEKYNYTLLDLTGYTDRLGRTTTFVLDANHQKIASIDPSGNKTQYAYFPGGQLRSITDPKGNITSWAYDLEGRPTKKTFADGSSVTYAYEASTSRLKSQTDALNQTKSFSYTVDDRVSGIAYSGATNPTPSVSFAYDPYYARQTSMTDGTGTTTFSYGPLGQLGALKLSKETGPISGGAIVYTYDALGRVLSRKIGASTAETYQYDAISRLKQHSSDLGAFTFAYLGQTAQLTQRALTGKSLVTNLTYQPNSADRRLASINNTGLNPSNYLNLSFATNVEKQITGVTEASDLPTVYPTASTQSVAVNTLNEITSVSGQAYTYDKNGNLTSDGVRTYKWDAENRLVSITYVGLAGKLTKFTYDGLGRRFQIAATPVGGGTAITTRYIWCGESICQARNASNSVVREYFGEGEYVPGATPISYYYGKDQIGTVRRVFASDGTSPAYAYDPYGAPLQSTAQVTDVGYAGMFTHADSGLNLTHFRVYNPKAGTWLTRDPAGEGASGANLFGYANGDPINGYDPLGLFCLPFPLQDLLNFAADHPLLIGIGVGCVASGVCEAIAAGLAVDLAADVLIEGLAEAAGEGAGEALAEGAAQVAPEAAAEATAATSTDFVVAPDGTVFPVPSGASGPTPVVNSAGNQTGVAFTGGSGGANNQVTTMRLMNPTPARGSSPGYPNGYVKYENANSQGVNPYTGQTIPNSQSHFIIN